MSGLGNLVIGGNLGRMRGEIERGGLHLRYGALKKLAMVLSWVAVFYVGLADLGQVKLVLIPGRKA